MHAVAMASAAFVAWPTAFCAAVAVMGTRPDASIFVTLCAGIIAAITARYAVVAIVRSVPARCTCRGRMWRVASRPIRYRCVSCGTAIEVGHDAEAADHEIHDAAAEERVARELAQAAPEAGALSEPAKPDGAVSLTRRDG